MAGVDRDGREKRTGLAGDALAIEDVAVAVDDQDIVGAVAVDVGHQRRGMRGGGELSGVDERPVALAQQHRDRVASASATARSRWPSPVKSPATIAPGYVPTA